MVQLQTVQNASKRSDDGDEEKPKNDIEKQRYRKIQQQKVPRKRGSEGDVSGVEYGLKKQRNIVLFIH